MQGYFNEMYKFIVNIIDNKDVIKSITIENTANVCKQFKNLAINVRLDYSKVHYDWSLLGVVKEPDENEIEARNKIHDAGIDLYHNKYKWDCHGWQDMVSTADSMYFDIQEVLRNNDIQIPIYFNILGHNNFNNKPNVIYDAMHDAEEMDIEDFLKTYINIDGKQTLNQILTDITLIWRRQRNIEEGIRTQKNAYILSKLIDNKAARKDYKENELLIEAYDAYIDVNKLFSGKKYA